jgi:hypothetical protein
MTKRGLDGRAVDEGGQIREKSGATKMRNLTKTYPELRVFSPDATLTGIRKRHGVESIADLRRLAAQKLRESGG